MRMFDVVADTPRTSWPRTSLLLSILCAPILLAGIWTAKSIAFDANAEEQDSKLTCEKAHYTVRTISFEPLIQHVENFVTPSEIKQLLSLAQGRFDRSTALYRNGSQFISPERTSSTALLTWEAPVTQCIIARATEFQGYVDPSMVEQLQVTRYLPGQYFTSHYDWLQGESDVGYIVDRDTTFFVTLEANCSNCGTHFPYMTFDWKPEDPRWCEIVDCHGNDGLIVKAVPGSAVVWKNLHENGRGDKRMLHEGLTARDGYKTGLNIWTRREFMLEGNAFIEL